VTRCYLDHNACAPLADEVVTALVEALSAPAANPSSVHREGHEMRLRVEAARHEVATLLGVGCDDVVFTSGGTEANAGALWGLWAAGGRPPNRRLLVGATEHPSVRAAVDALRAFGASIEEIPVSGDGLVSLEALESALGRRGPAIVVVQVANSETGVLQPLGEIDRLCRDHGAWLHCDGVQAAGKVTLRPRELGATTLAVAGHKLGAPAGVGALIVTAGVRLAPLIPGSQEGHRRGGSENLLGIVGFGVAARVARGTQGQWAALGIARDAMERRLLTALPGALVLGQTAPRLPNTTCLALAAPLRGGVVAAALDMAGFAVSAGPACTAGAEGASPAALAMGFSEAVARRTLRVSLGLATDPETIDRFTVALEDVARRVTGVRE